MPWQRIGILRGIHHETPSLGEEVGGVRLDCSSKVFAISMKRTDPQPDLAIFINTYE